MCWLDQIADLSIHQRKFSRLFDLGRLREQMPQASSTIFVHHNGFHPEGIGHHAHVFALTFKSTLLSSQGSDALCALALQPLLRAIGASPFGLSAAVWRNLRNTTGTLEHKSNRLFSRSRSPNLPAFQLRDTPCHILRAKGVS
jgi:hypothetical protein